MKCIGEGGGTVWHWEHGPRLIVSWENPVSSLLQFKTELSLVKCRHISSGGAGGGMLNPIMTLFKGSVYGAFVFADVWASTGCCFSVSIVSDKLHAMPHFSDITPHSSTRTAWLHRSHSPGKLTFVFG